MDVGTESSFSLTMADAPAGMSARMGESARSSIPWPERCLDIALIVLVSPVLALVALALATAVYVDSPGPVIYRSRRVGRDGELFDMLKFRKMRREAHSQPLTLDDDERFTPIGRFLAATRLDELPQVINILRGDMRLVGPRPELECFVAEFAEEYAEIVTVSPGLTGNAQLRFVGEKALFSGPSPETAYTDHVMPAKVAIDLDYVRHHSVIRDVLILARTVALPFELLVDRLRDSSASLRVWIPTAACAALLILAFVVASGSLA
jgi:lipopolysaccharide/colanic/teichoic acid biosynthesis glycosyltransferase